MTASAEPKKLRRLKKLQEWLTRFLSNIERRAHEIPARRIDQS